MKSRGLLIHCAIFFALFQCHVTCMAACTVSSTGLNFGNYDPSALLDKLGAGTVTVNCSLGATYAVSLSSGKGTFSQRQLSNGASVLNYNVYIDASRLLVWGDGSGTTNSVSGIGTGTNVNLTAYGKMTAQQNVAVGTYSDSLVVTISF